MKSFLALVLILSACAHRPTGSVPATVSPAPPAAAVARALVVKKIPEVKAQPYFQFSWGDRSFRVAHGKWKIAEENPGWNRMYGYGPVVWVTVGERTRVLDLRQDFPSRYVANVFHDEDSGRIILFFDYGIEGPAAAYQVWVSEDRGEHWFAGQDLVRPPGTFPPAALENFFLDQLGHGTAWFKLEAAHLEPMARGSMPPGADVYYRSVTIDGGRTWRAEPTPAFSNVVRQAEEKHH